MHILQLPSWFPSESEPAAGVFFAEQAAALQRAGHTVGVLDIDMRPLRALWRRVRRADAAGTPRGPAPRVLRARPVAWVPRSHRASAWLWMRAGERLFRRYVATHGTPDVLHAHCCLLGGALATQLGQRFGLPAVVTEHRSIYMSGAPTAWTRRLTVTTLGRANARLVVSSALGRRLETLFGACAVPWQLVPNSVPARFATAALAPEPPAAGPHRLISVGSLVPRKGYRQLLQAVALCRRQGTTVQLRVVGDGPLRTDLQRQAERLGIEAHVSFAGALHPNEVVDEVRRAHVLVNSSHHETFGVAIIEALAVGLPVVATRCGGPEDIVTPNNGLLVPPGDPESLAAGIAQLCARLQSYDRARLRAECLERFGEPAVVALLEAIYAEACGQPSRSHETGGSPRASHNG